MHLGDVYLMVTAILRSGLSLVTIDLDGGRAR
jgi:hypothetical protein